MTLKSRLMNKWSVFKENHPTSHICVMIILVNIVFILFSTLLISMLPENSGRGLWETIRLAFTLMINPSGKYTYSEAPVSLILTTVVVLLGMISLTGGTVGFITSLINAFMEKTANSKRSMKLRDHIVILNYNERVPSILADYCFDDVKSTYIVILTDEDKETVNKKIDEIYSRAGIKKRFKNVIVRTGSPMSRIDLDRAAVSSAKTVMLMTPENGDAFSVSKLYLFMNCYFSEIDAETKPHIVVETADDSMDGMLRETNAEDTSRDIIGVQYGKLIGKILGVTSIMPTVNDVLRQLFSFEGTEIYTKPIPACGIDEEMLVNRSVLPIGDMDGRRVYVAENEEEFDKKISGYRLEKPLPAHIVKPDIAFAKTEVVIVGINSKLPFILESLSCFKTQYNNKELHAILADTEDKREELLAYYSDSQYADILMPMKYSPIIIKDIYRPMDELGYIVNNTASTVVFLSDERASDIDEKPLLYWSNINCGLSRKSQCDIVVELLSAENREIIRRRNRDQILVSDDFLGHLYAQLGKNPRRLGVIMDMITSEGDTASVNTQNETQNEGDLMCVDVDTLFESGKYDLEFKTKRELIVWMYRATGGAVLPIGIAREGVSYLFSRTDGDNDGLDSDVLLGIKEGQKYETVEKGIRLCRGDEIIAFIKA